MLDIIHFKEDNIIGFRLEGRIEEDSFDEAVTMMEKMLEKHDKIRVYAEIEEIGGMNVNTFMKDIHFKLKHFTDFEKEAIVSDKPWLETWIGVANTIFPHIEVKHFAPDHKEEAKEWLRK